MDQKPLVSVIIPTYNRAHLMPRCIGSVLSQTYSNCEIIVVDDASSDDTAGAMKQYADSPTVKYIRVLENKGACNARNVGIADAKGEYITFLDSDDEYLPDKVACQVAQFEKNKGNNVVVVSCGREDARDGQVYFTWIPKFKGNIMEHLLNKDRVGAGTPFLMVKKETLVRNNVFFDPQMPAGQDWDFLVRLCQFGEFDFVPQVLVRVHHHTEERVYNPVRAMKAVSLQYGKYQYLFDKYPDSRRSFILRQALMHYNYNQRKEALDMLGTIKGGKNFKEQLWLQYFKLFPVRKSFLSKAVYSLVFKLSLNE
ncbi:MAG: glycosyltransferase family 2 protein [Sphingobacteriales bacterium]|nr:MAG: glycosyltransferase family 2 protein [Sphingobacteriales bacterium]